MKLPLTIMEAIILMLHIMILTTRTLGTSGFIIITTTHSSEETLDAGMVTAMDMDMDMVIPGTVVRHGDLTMATTTPGDGVTGMQDGICIIHTTMDMATDILT